MAAKFRLPHRYPMVGVYRSRIHSDFNRHDHHQFPGNQSSRGKSGEEPKN